MIAGCIGKMRRSDCGTCSKQDPCARLWPAFASIRRSMAARPRPAASPGPFMAILGEVAKAVDAMAQKRGPAAEAAPRSSRYRQEVERRLDEALESGEVGIDGIARDLGHSRQTLYRRLKAEGTTYERLLDGVRRRQALRLLREQGASVKEAAYRLGYSEPAAFSRAFKRWTGTSPGEMRRPH